MHISRAFTKLAPRQAKGFTLVELLVVVMIIVILMAALMPIYSKVQDKARRTATENMIGVLAASLERYKVAFDCYPPNASGGTEDDGTLFESLNGKDNRGLTANAGTRREQHYEPFLGIGKEYLRKGNGDKLIIVDSWGTPIHYFNSKAYIEEKNGDPKKCYNPASVDIYSLGRDKKKDEDLVDPGSGIVKEKGMMKLVDDITNF